VELLALLLVPAAAFLVLAPMIHVPFDTETASRYIAPFLFGEGSDLGWAATESVPIGIFRPLYGLSFLVDFRIWGSSPEGYHLTDLLMTWGAFALAYALFRRRLDRWTSALAVSLWILLPAQLHSMLHFYGRNDRIMIYFLLASLLLYDREIDAGDRPGRTRGLVLAGATLSLGLLAKESVFYYGFVLFAWSVMIVRRSLRSTLLRDWPLWVSIFAVAALYIGTRALLGIRLGDDNELDTGVVYLGNLGQMVLWGTPFRLPVDVNVELGIAAWVVAAALALLGRLPREIRFGGFCLLAGFLHLPLFWIQRSFLWIPWLFGSLAVAGITLRIASAVRGRLGAAGRVAAAALPFVILAGAATWSFRECVAWCRYPLVIDDAVDWIVENGEGPVYSGSMALARLPEFREAWAARAGDPVSERKLWAWMTELARIRTGVEGLRIEWEPGTGASGR